MQYTHKEMIEICDESKRIMIKEFKSMIEMLEKDVSGECVWIDDIANGIDEIEQNCGLK